MLIVLEMFVDCVFIFMLGVVADPVALAKYRLWSIDRNDKSRC